MKKGTTLSERTLGKLSHKLKSDLSIGYKIILPYLVLTLVVAGVGAFVISNLVASSLEERFSNQLLDAGRIVSESTIQYEESRLQTLRTVAGTLGVPEAVADADAVALAKLVPQIIANSNSHSVILLDRNGQEIYGWHQLPSSGFNAPRVSYHEDFSSEPEVRQVLDGIVDAYGDKRILLWETEGLLTLYTVGPVFFEGELVGAAMVGDEIRQMTTDLAVAAVAHVSLYDQKGRLLETTLGGGQESENLAQSLDILNESQSFYEEVSRNAQDITPVRLVNLLEQEYKLAYGDWRLRNQSAGMFSVALPSNFIISAISTSRNSFSLIFALATLGVLAVGFLTARQIIRPVDRLVQTALAVSSGDLAQRSGIESQDEIGKLAEAFDLMTQTLAERNQDLAEQASKLEAVINSIVDGVIVLDMDDHFITTNTAAQKLLVDMSHDFHVGPLRELTAPSEGRTIKSNGSAQSASSAWVPRQYQIGNRVLSARAAPVKTSERQQVGTVIVLRDITSEAEAGRLKDAFITSISHELRTPLTVIKVYTDLILKTANGQMDARYVGFLQKISRNSDHLEQHINQLINISELQAGTFNLNMKRLDFVALVQEVVDKWRERFEGKALTVDVQLLDSPVWIQADPDQLKWAVEVLLSNAHNYTLNGRVTVRVFNEPNEVRLDVIDTGIGIAAADQPHLFDRFFRASNALNYNVRGVGLGLFITRSIVELHDGRIWLESESGQGSVFSIALPLDE